MKNPHIFDELVGPFSKDRLHRYLHHTPSQNKTEALVSYSWNIELSQSLYPALQIFEISLRNSLHQAISSYYKSNYWFNLPILYRKEQVILNLAKERVLKENKELTASRIIAELSFGFWTSLFDVRYEHHQILWPKLIKPTFPHLPKSQRTRSFLSCELNKIRRLRNRIFHYEPIWYWKDLLNQHEHLLRMIKFISPTSALYLTTLDHFRDIHTMERSKIKKNIELIQNGLETYTQAQQADTEISH